MLPSRGADYGLQGGSCGCEQGSRNGAVDYATRWCMLGEPQSSKKVGGNNGPPQGRREGKRKMVEKKPITTYCLSNARSARAPRQPPCSAATEIRSGLEGDLLGHPLSGQLLRTGLQGAEVVGSGGRHGPGGAVITVQKEIIVTQCVGQAPRCDPTHLSFAG